MINLRGGKCPSSKATEGCGGAAMFSVREHKVTQSVGRGQQLHNLRRTYPKAAFGRTHNNLRMMV
jgi:hypothetical protein